MNVARSLGLALALAVVAMCATVSAHERKEVAGLNVLFGAEPEPALTGEMQFLRWRFTAQDQTPFTDLEEMKAIVTRNGKTHGEEWRERRADAHYWAPLTAELAALRRARVPPAVP